MKKIALLLVLLISVSVMVPVLSGCNRYEALDTSIAAELNIMTWSGTSTYIEDIGHKTFAEDELAGASNEADLYAVAKAFNEIYPNVKINIFCKVGSESDENGSWAQHRENFKAEHGSYPDVFATKNLVEDMGRGLAADLSVFKDDPFYKTFNPGLLSGFNFKGIQGGLPSFAEPWGVYVNKSLAEANNIDVPDVNWTFDDYTDFISAADGETFWGAMDAYSDLYINGATKDIDYQLVNRKDGEPYVNVNSEDVKSILAYTPEWSKHAIWSLYEQGKITDAVMDEYWWWNHKFFYENKLLTNVWDPWMIGDSNLSNVEDWDYYPMPALPGNDNNVVLLLDAICVYNYALDDGDPELSEEELAKMKIAYEFTKFYVADTRAWQSRLDTKFLSADTNTLVSSMSDTFPVVTGEEFDKQMEIWFSTEQHAYLKDKPGFKKVMELWEGGKLYGSMGIPQSYTVEGETKWCMQEWWGVGSKDVVGASVFEANWLDNVLAKLPEWNDTMNTNFKTAEDEFIENCATFYGLEVE